MTTWRLHRKWVPALLMAVWLLGPLIVRAQETQASAAAPPPIVRASIDPAKAVLGQHVRLTVEVLFPERMPAPPQTVTPQAPGLQVFRFESQGLTMRDTIEGQPYVGQQFEFALYPRRAGTLAVPPVEIRLMDRSGNVAGTTASAAQTLIVSAPPGVDPARPSIASTEVTLTESWEPPEMKAPLHVGDALVRVIRRAADDTPALGFAALNGTAPAGVRAYADQPVSNDRIERGTLTGERTDRITYVFEKPGDYTLPQVTQNWWDLKAGALRSEVGAEKTVSVAVAAPPAGSGDQAKAFASRWFAALAAGAVVLAALIGGGSAWLRERLRAKHGDSPSPFALFRTLQRAARSGDARATWRALAAWRAVARIEPGTLAALAPVRDLERSLFASRGAWSRDSGAALIEALQKVRLGASRTSRARGSLPPLNPTIGEAP